MISLTLFKALFGKLEGDVVLGGQYQPVRCGYFHYPKIARNVREGRESVKCHHITLGRSRYFNTSRFTDFLANPLVWIDGSSANGKSPAERLVPIHDAIQGHNITYAPST